MVAMARRRWRHQTLPADDVSRSSAGAKQRYIGHWPMWYRCTRRHWPLTLYTVCPRPTTITAAVYPLIVTTPPLSYQYVPDQLCPKSFFHVRSSSHTCSNYFSAYAHKVSTAFVVVVVTCLVEIDKQKFIILSLNNFRNITRPIIQWMICWKIYLERIGVSKLKNK